jgi:hypothetical protein
MDVKSNDGKMNLFMYIVSQTESDLGRSLYDDRMAEQINFEFLSKTPI